MFVDKAQLLLFEKVEVASPINTLYMAIRGSNVCTSVFIWFSLLPVVLPISVYSSFSCSAYNRAPRSSPNCSVKNALICFLLFYIHSTTPLQVSATISAVAFAPSRPCDKTQTPTTTPQLNSLINIVYQCFARLSIASKVFVRQTTLFTEACDDNNNRAQR